MVEQNQRTAPPSHAWIESPPAARQSLHRTWDPDLTGEQIKCVVLRTLWFMDSKDLRINRFHRVPDIDHP